MSLSTFSRFHYGLTVSNTNNKLNFSEGAGELTATIAVGTYSFADLFTAVKTALDAAGANTYGLSVDRSTRIITINADANFELLTSSGSNDSVSIFPLLGFNQASDLTGADTYDGDTAAALVYEPQFVLQDYDAPENWKERESPSVNMSASGLVEVVSFGLVSFINMSIKFITDKAHDNYVIKNNPTGVADAQAFFEAITARGVFEFMPDKDTPNTFHKVILESMDGNNTGTGYKLKELRSQNLPGYYEVNNIKLRVIE